ncbi:MAG: T9SS type A sorting domain-containing protein, partial [Candidatus Cloacimonetes bacterium]|nr:T9SS type A sorting domain-containing protein [Candidatus Cloacimonadota bacterium]
IEIYNIKGQKVYSNQLEQIKSGGNSTFWNGSDHKGTPCAPGVYLMRIKSGDTILKGRFTKIK